MSDSLITRAMSILNIPDKSYLDMDFVVLVNGSTASAGELFTSAIKDYGLAKIVGTRT